jgi:hypothetical protein
MWPKRLNLIAGKENQMAQFQVFFQGKSLTKAEHQQLKWAVYDREYQLLKDNAVSVTSSNTSKRNIVSGISVDTYLSKADIYEYIVECKFKDAKAKAFVGVPKEGPYHKIRILAPETANKNKGIIDLKSNDYEIKWAETPDVEYFKINIRRSDTSAIIFSETIPGNRNSITIRRNYFSFEDKSGAQCVLDIFAYYPSGEYQHKDYGIWLGI